MDDRERERVVPACEVLINGNRLPPEAEADLFALEVTDELDAIGMFTAWLNAGDPMSGRTKWVDADLFREGGEVRVKMGFHAPLPEILSAEITALEPEFPEKGPVVFTVRGFDRLYRLGLGRKTRSFRNMADSEIAAQVAQDRGLTPQVDETQVRYEYVLQNNLTDLEFLRGRARRIGYELTVDAKNLCFRKSQAAAGKVLTLTYGEGLLSFFPRLSLAAQMSEVVVQGWNTKDKKETSGRAGAGDELTRMGGSETGAAVVKRVAGTASLVAVGEPPASPEDAEIMAKGQFNAMAFDFVSGEGSCMGQPDIRTGSVIELRGLGRRFSGLYYVSSATHSFSVRKGYVTTFSVRRSAA